MNRAMRREADRRRDGGMDTLRNPEVVVQRLNPDGTGARTEGQIPPERARVIEAVRIQDTRYFEAHPDSDRYERAYVPGEAWPEEVDADRVAVLRVGLTRARAFYRGTERVG